MDDWRSGREDSFSRKRGSEVPEPEHLEEEQERADWFLQHIVIPALQKAAQEVSKAGRQTSLVTGRNLAGMIVIRRGREEFQYDIRVTVTPESVSAAPITTVPDSKTGERVQSRGILREGVPAVNVDTISKEEILRHFLGEWKRQGL
jgi:hypothetical protein